jgi:6-phosphofructokinase 2
MNRIVTLTFNPALDKSSTAERVVPEDKIRCSKPVYEPGGGGINISRALKKLGADSLAIYAKGGPSGHVIKHLLEKDGIKQHTIETLAPTRENFILVETSTNNQFRFGMPGEIMTEAEVKEFVDYIENLEGCEYLIASGSLPNNIPLNIYATIGEIAKRKKIKYIVDSTKEALDAAFDEGVLLAKPNIAELSEFVGRELNTKEEQIEAAHDLINKGKVEILVISLGPDGALIVTKDKHFTVKPPKTEKKSTVGAGDSMVAGLIYKLSNGASIEEAAMYAVSSGTAATMNVGTELCKKEDVEWLFGEIKKTHAHLLN